MVRHHRFAKRVLAIADDGSCKKAIRFLHPPRIISVLPNAIRTVWSPAIFCRVMAYVLGDYIGKICLCYLDDVIIFGGTQRELLDRLDQGIQRLHEFGLKVKPSKCVLFRTEIKFLGHLVSASVVQPLPDEVSAIADWPTPRCLRDVRAFYGLIGYYRRFIEGFATVAEPLMRLTVTKAKVNFQFS